MELQDIGLFGTCENDVRSTVAMMVFGAMTKGRMGYISDPAIDSSVHDTVRRADRTMYENKRKAKKQRNTRA